MHQRRARRQRRLEIDDRVERLDVDDRRRAARPRRCSGSRRRPSRSARRRTAPCLSRAAAACTRETRGPESAADCTSSGAGLAVVAEIVGGVDGDDAWRARARPRRRRSSACRARTSLRTNATCSIPGSCTSSTNSARPVSSRASSLRRTRRPTVSDGHAAVSRRSRRRRRSRPRRDLHGVDDVLVAGAAAEIRRDARRESAASSGFGLSRRNAVSVISMPGRAEAALQRVRFAKRGLQRIQLAPSGDRLSTVWMS